MPQKIEEKIYPNYYSRERLLSTILSSLINSVTIQRGEKKCKFPIFIEFYKCKLLKCVGNMILIGILVLFFYFLHFLFHNNVEVKGNHLSGAITFLPINYLIFLTQYVSMNFAEYWRRIFIFISQLMFIYNGILAHNIFFSSFEFRVSNL